MATNTYAANDTPPLPKDQAMRYNHTQDSVEYNMQHIKDHGQSIIDSLHKLKGVSPDKAHEVAHKTSMAIGAIHDKVNDFTGGVHHMKTSYGMANKAPKGPKIPAAAKAPSGATKKTGSFQGKSNQLGGGGRAAQLKARGMSGGLIRYLGTRKFGAKSFNAMARAGRSRAR